MKFFLSCLAPTLILLIAFACKKHKDPSPQFADITATPCKLASYGDNYYTVEYTGNGKISKIFEHYRDYVDPSIMRTKLHLRFQYENGFLKRTLTDRPNAMDTSSAEAYTLQKFEYGPHGIERVDTYDYGLEYRYDFKYDGSNRPTSMTMYVNFDNTRTREDLKQTATYQYDYDENGNIVKEYCQQLHTPYNYTVNYRYDNAPNSIKLFESFYFLSSSAAPVFSKNNIIESQIVDSDTEREKYNDTQFDSQNKLIIKYRSFDGIVWDCK